MRHHLLTVFILLSVFSTVNAQERPLVFAHVTDIHIGNKTAAADLENTITDINTNDSIQFVIITGDITEFGSRAELLEARNLLNRLNKKWYIIPGNHDTKWSESGCQDFINIFGGDSFIFKENGTWFIGTNSGPNMRMGPGQTPMENITWLRSRLDSIGKDEPVVYINHYPQNSSLNNWYLVLDMLRPYNVKLFVCGHGHRNKVMDIEGVPGIMGRSNLRAKDSVGGYNIVSISGGKIYYSEKRPGAHTANTWYSSGWDTERRPQWSSNPDRPDFRVNDSFPFVKPSWVIREKADIGGGMLYQDGRLYYTNTAGTVYCVKAENKKSVWKYETGTKIYSTPAISGETVWITLANGNIAGLHRKNGTLRDTFSTAAPFVSSPVVSGDTIFAAGSDGHCRAWNSRTHRLIWDYDSINNFVETKPLLKEGVLYFGSWGNRFYALDSRTGRARWIWSNGAENRMLSSAAVWPVLAAEKLYMVAPDRYMTVLDINSGREIWRFKDEQNWVRESQGISEDHRTVYVKTMQGNIIAFDAYAPERKIRWTASESLGYDICPTAIKEKDGVVFVPTQSGTVVAIDARNGMLLWKHKVSNCLVTDILPAGNRRLFVSTMDGVVTCLKW